jgi:hypothetical protein
MNGGSEMEQKLKEDELKKVIGGEGQTGQTGQAEVIECPQSPTFNHVWEKGFASGHVMGEYCKYCKKPKNGWNTL